MKTISTMPPYKYKGKTFSLKWALALMKREGAQQVTKRDVPRNSRKRKSAAAT